MTDEISGRLAALVKQGREFVDELADQSDEEWIDDSIVALHETWLASVGNLLLAIGGAQSDHFREFRKIVTSQRNPAGLQTYVMRRTFDVVLAVLDEWSQGTVRRVEDIVAATMLDDLVDRAVDYRDERRKVEAGILAATVFEHALRRVIGGHALSLEAGEGLLDALERSGVLEAAELTRLRRCEAVQQRAKAGQWDGVDLDGVTLLIEGTRKLIQDRL